MMRATFATVGYKADSFDDLNNWLNENKPEFAAPEGVRFSGKCISKKLHPLDMMLMCRSSSDCEDKWGHFNGGCCERSDVIKGQDKMDKEMKEMFDLQGEKGGFCAPATQANYAEEKKEHNMMEYNRWQFENDFLMRNVWLFDVPMEERDDVTWDDVTREVRKMYPNFDDMNDIWFTAQCIDKRVPGEPIDWEEWMDQWMGDMDDDWMGRNGIEIEMEDDMMSISMEGDDGRMMVEMGEGENGGYMRIVMESATKVGASLATLAAMTLY